MAAEQTPAGPQRGSSSEHRGGALAYRLVAISVIGVILAFLVVMLILALLGIFNQENVPHVSAALSSLFGIVGTLVGTYFGIKSSSEARGSLENTTTQAISATHTALNRLPQDAPREDFVALINALHATWNAGSQENQGIVVGFFANNAVVSLVTSDKTEPYTGQEQIRSFIQKYMPGSRVDSRNYRSIGTRVSWESTVRWDSASATPEVSQKGLDQIDGTAMADFEGTKISSLTFTLSPATQPGVEEDPPY